MHTIRWKTALVFGILALAASGSAAGILYVDANAPGLNNGTSWANAYRYLQDALADANTAAKPVEVRVARGVYRPDQGAAVKLGDTKATFRLRSGLALRGGYAGRGHPDPNAWNPNLYQSVLSGDLLNNDDFSRTATLRDNSEHIVTATDADKTAVLEGFVIADGAYFYATVFDGFNDPYRGGAGLRNEAGSPTISRCVFRNNYVENASGSAVLDSPGSTATFTACTFENNNSSAMCDFDSNSVVVACTFRDNYAAIIASSSDPCLSSCTFVGNQDVGLALNGGSRAILLNCSFTANTWAINAMNDEIQCTDCTFTANRTGRALNSAVWVQNGRFIRCTFRDNLIRSTKGTWGGAITAKYLTLENCLFVHNSAEGAGAVYCMQGSISQCIFAGNEASSCAALSVSGATTVSNCTFVGNRSDRFGVISGGSVTKPVILMNCIFNGNVCPDAVFPLLQTLSGMTVRFCCLQSLDDGKYAVNSVGNIVTDPLFAKTGYWDPNGTPNDPNDDFWVDGDYHLKSQAGRWDQNNRGWVIDDATSPCIDAGDPNSPVGAEPSPNGSRIDIGAYGGTVEASRSPYCGLSILWYNSAVWKSWSALQDRRPDGVGR